MTGDVEARIAVIAARQHGVVQRRQLLASGVTAEVLKSRLRSGCLRRVHSGVYMPTSLRGPLEPRLAPEMAAVLACGPGALVSRRSAAALLDLGPPPRDPAKEGRWRPVDVAFPQGRTPARRPGIRTHRAGPLEAGDVTTVEGIPVTAPSRTLLDLAAVSTARELERAVARAERLGLIDPGDIEHLIERARGRRGARLLRSVIQREGGPKLTRSEAEVRFLDLVRGTGLPAPEVNVVVEGYEIDFLWRECGVAVEVDGFAYHRSRRSFAGDRRRDGDLLGVGIRTLRVTWSQIVDEPKATLVRLARAFGGAAGGGGPHAARRGQHGGSSRDRLRGDR
jgi:very-short-patch-repair endonuclease